MTTVLTLPGLSGSGATHWQTRWEQLHGARRVEQPDWEQPERETWIATLDRAIAAQSGRVVLVAHSLGCALVAHWAAYATSAGLATIKAALLVAPPDVGRADMPKQVVGFAPLPRQALPFESTLIGSTDDPFCSIDRIAAIASDWHSDFVNIGAAGHINSDSGLGDWPAGWRFVESWL
jgi:predicted alpha/beta hydrolase family esterase